eukprot:TRINITY_DN97414_c0_g1_i1.p1 TRINITY_DN97414_c0_g1~~TRINITY_DN97414_c0_g1_i1.p1  ORF type:complete len:587 (-),score=134.20 TRINITY_DN97414_c0_g1_i1:16-1776(-)
MTSPGHDKLQSIWDFIGEGEEESSSELEGEISATQAEVPASLFQEPCEALCTSGGTAAFFLVRYRKDADPLGPDAEDLVGKDLAHASDEVDFYSKLRKTSQDKEWAVFGNQALACLGITRLQCIIPKLEAAEPRTLLLLENLRGGFQQMRLLDIKLGAETSVAGWKKKSRLNALKNSCVDSRTNSAVEGFRLEGIEAAPKALEERLGAIIEAKMSSPTKRIATPKAIARFTLQRLRGSELLEAMFDASHLGHGSELHAQAAIWSSLEQVCSLLGAVVKIPTPQQWIGSSVALAVEVGKCSEEPRTLVKVFDWGRSELTTAAEYAVLEQEVKLTRMRYWRQYVRALGRLCWEFSRLALHRCCAPAWTALVVELQTFVPAVIRAALLGNYGSAWMETFAMSLFPLPSDVGGGPVSLPLLATTEQVFGLLHAHISQASICAASAGMSSCVVELGQATQVDLDSLDGRVTVLRVLAFEHFVDARAHVEAWHACRLPEAEPRGRVYGMSSSPAKVQGEALVWNNRLEFLGHGEGVTAAQHRLQECLGHGLSPAELLPSIVGGQDQMNEKAQIFTRHFAPWIDNEAIPSGYQ